MINLEKYGVVELKKEELSEVEREWILPILRFFAELATAAVGVHEVVHEVVHNDVCGGRN